MAANSDPDKTARGELALIGRLRTICKPPTLARVAFGDDMAGVDPSGLLATTDMLMDGVDFESHKQSLEAIGFKCLAVNLSDCAAMAAVPLSALVSVALPQSWTLSQAEQLYTGLQECAEQHQCPIVGGDTNSWDQPLVVSVTVTARPHERGPVMRNGARVDNSIYVSGPLGGSIRGRHLHPLPQLKLAQRLAAVHAPSAMIDISDGLAVDLNHILTASGCGAELDEQSLQSVIHTDAHALATEDARSAIDHALHDGEDFELLFTAATIPEAPAKEMALHCIGKIVAGSGIVRVAEDGSRIPVPPIGWEHFR